MSYIYVEKDCKKINFKWVVREFFLQLLDNLKVELSLKSLDPSISNPYIIYEPFFEKKYLIIDNPIKNDPFFEKNRLDLDWVLKVSFYTKLDHF